MSEPCGLPGSAFRTKMPDKSVILSRGSFPVFSALKRYFRKENLARDGGLPTAPAVHPPHFLMNIVLKDLTKIFPKSSRNKLPVTAVDNFNIEIPDGKLVGLLGPSGCGKSTALNLISGLEKPTRGQIFFGDTDVTDLPPERRGVGMVFQNYALYPHLTVLQNILFPMQNLKGKERISKEEMNARAEEAARLVQINELMDRRPGELSGGQQQRVAIARAIVKKPGVLLLDEPLSNLDARLRLQTREEIRRIQNETKITTVFVTHDQDEAMSISDLIILMESGSLNQVGKPQEVYDSPVNLFVAKFLGTPPINIFKATVREGTVYIGDVPVACTDSGFDGDATVGIRPEGFIPDRNGMLRCGLSRVEVMGRDTSIVFTHPQTESGSCRAIISSESLAEVSGTTVCFSLKFGKIHVFDPKTGSKIETRPS